VADLGSGGLISNSGARSQNRLNLTAGEGLWFDALSLVLYSAEEVFRGIG